MTLTTVERPALRGKALTKWRKATAVDLAAQGLSYDQIAEAVGYANRGTAWRVVQEALTDRIPEEVDTLRESQVRRLNTLQAALWPKAIEGDPKSVDLVLKISLARTRLLALEQPARKDEPAEQPRTFWVLPGADRVSSLRFNVIVQDEAAGRHVSAEVYREAGLEPGEALEMVRDQLAW